MEVGPFSRNLEMEFNRHSWIIFEMNKEHSDYDAAVFQSLISIQAAAARIAYT